MVKIIIPVLGNNPFLKDTLARLYNRQLTKPSEFRLILINNGCKDPAFLRYLKTLTRATIINLKENLGFSSAVNFGLKLIKNEDVLLLNDDVVFSKDWLSILIRTLYANKNVGLLGPYTSRAGVAQTIPEINGKRMSFERISDYSERLFNKNGYNVKDIIYPHILTGFCLLIKNEVFKKVGLLDPNLKLYDDDDYCRRVLMQGYRCCISEGCFVYHYGQRTFRKIFEIDQYQKLFYDMGVCVKEKWEKMGYDQKYFVDLSLELKEKYSDVERTSEQ